MDDTEYIDSIYKYPISYSFKLSNIETAKLCSSLIIKTGYEIIFKLFSSYKIESFL